MDPHPSANGPTNNVAQGATLASLITLIDGDPDLPECNRREITSAIRTVATVLRTEPHLVPATARDLGPLLRDALPTAVKVSATRWRNAKSLLCRGLAKMDPQTIPGRSQVRLLPAWREIMQLAKSVLDENQATALNHGLSRFSRYCSAKAISPAGVTQALYDGFFDDLVEHSTVRSPREVQQTAGNAWNKACKMVPGWPVQELEMRDFRRNRSMPWSAFPDSLCQDVEAYLTIRSPDEFDLFAEAPPLRASTIVTKRNQIRLFATAVVEGGHAPHTLCSLKDLVTIDTATAGLIIL